MSREHVNLLRSEIKSETGVDKTTYEVFRKKIIRTYMDAVENNNRHDYDSRLIREFNNRCDQLSLTISSSEIRIKYFVSQSRSVQLRLFAEKES